MDNIEKQKPDAVTVEFTRTILAQNERILMMNEELLRILTHPVYVVTEGRAHETQN